MKPKPLSVMRLIVPVVGILDPLEELAEIGPGFLPNGRASRQQGRGPVPQRELYSVTGVWVLFNVVRKGTRF